MPNHQKNTKRKYTPKDGDTSGKEHQELIILRENAKSVARQGLPDITEASLHFASGVDDDQLGNGLTATTTASATSFSGTILLFYQYKEPPWTPVEHKQVLKDFIVIAQRFSITGRGRVAQEGLNCTLTGSSDMVRQFCTHLREDYNPQLFAQTDFKLTDGIPYSKLFKSLSIRKTDELVAFGMAGEDKSPRLDKFAGVHLTAAEYHEAMQRENTVIVDVRNAYETALGHFEPPAGCGAILLDPKLRRSNEFPNWLADPQTQAQLHGKNVLMYCTGGIRCERATALVNQMASASSPETFQPLGVYELQGGIERYLKTFPQGGLWKGKNYLFDRRMEQVPALKPLQQVEQECAPCCVVCHSVCTKYRGQFQCAGSAGTSLPPPPKKAKTTRPVTAVSCGVPVIVCSSCTKYATDHFDELRCPLCQEGYQAPPIRPNLTQLKQRAEQKTQQISKDQPQSGVSRREAESMMQNWALEDPKKIDSAKLLKGVSEGAAVCRKDCLFVSRLPLTTTKTKMEALFGSITVLHWLTDRRTYAFYGSCIIQLSSSHDAKQVLNQHQRHRLVMDKKKIKVQYFWQPALHQPTRQGDGDASKTYDCLGDSVQVWPPSHPRDGEYPPIGHPAL
ncbi:hypothetical protein ACA910_012396 [Epithemia clementina (nom. ined.)]